MGLFIYYRKRSALIACWKALTPASLSFASPEGRSPARQGWANPLFTSILGCWVGKKLAHRDQAVTGELSGWPQLSSLARYCIRRAEQGDDISISHRPLIPMGLTSMSIPMVQNYFACGFCFWDPSFYLTTGNDQSHFHEGWHSGKTMEVQSWEYLSPTAALFGRLDAGCVFLLLSHSWRSCIINWWNEVHLHL